MSLTLTAPAPTFTPVLTPFTSINVILSITEEDIELGVANKCNACPGARAALRALSILNPTGVMFYGGDSMVGTGKLTQTLAGPRVMLDTDLPHYHAYHAGSEMPFPRFVMDFDNGGRVSPVSAEVTYRLRKP